MLSRMNGSVFVLSRMNSGPAIRAIADELGAQFVLSRMNENRNTDSVISGCD